MSILAEPSLCLWHQSLYKVGSRRLTQLSASLMMMALSSSLWTGCCIPCFLHLWPTSWGTSVRCPQRDMTMWPSSSAASWASMPSAASMHLGKGPWRLSTSSTTSTLDLTLWRTPGKIHLFIRQVHALSECSAIHYSEFSDPVFQWCSSHSPWL